MTTLEDSVKQRIEATVPQLTGAIDEIADIAALIAAGALPQREVFAFVVPLGFDDVGGGTSAAGVHTQMIKDAVGVVLGIKALGDARAKKSLPTITSLRDAVKQSVAGWAPDNSAGVFNVIKGRLLSVNNGLVLYQLDFALLDQLRILA